MPLKCVAVQAAGHAVAGLVLGQQLVRRVSHSRFRSGGGCSSGLAVVPAAVRTHWHSLRFSSFSRERGALVPLRRLLCHSHPRCSYSTCCCWRRARDLCRRRCCCSCAALLHHHRHPSSPPPPSLLPPSSVAPACKRCLANFSLLHASPPSPTPRPPSHPLHLVFAPNFRQRFTHAQSQK